MQPFAMSLHQPLPKLAWAPHLLWLVRDLQTCILRLRLERARPWVEDYKLEGTRSSLRFLSLVRLWNSVVRTAGSGPTRQRRSLKIGGRNPKYLRKCLLRLLFFLLFLSGRGTSHWRRVAPLLTTCFPQRPLLPLLLSLVKVLLTRLCVCLAGPLVEGQVFQYKVLPRHYLFWQLPRKNIGDVRMGLLDNRQQVTCSKQRLMMPLNCSDLE